MNFRIFLSSSIKNDIDILIGVIVSLQIILGRMGIITLLILPIHECQMPFNLFVDHSISFEKVL